MPRPAPLTVPTLRRAAATLAVGDRALGRVLETYGPPPLWPRAASFESLVRMIIEQQVSLASAEAVFTRLTGLIEPVDPHGILTADPRVFVRAGVTRQKTGYLRALAEAVSEGELDLEGLKSLDDDGVRECLVRVKGIGPWTADCYLLMALRRPDVFPPGDVALVSALRSLKPRVRALDVAGVARHARRWRPWRSVAARILWHFYLSERARGGPPDASCRLA